jgi:hypothetical protein
MPPQGAAKVLALTANHGTLDDEVPLLLEDARTLVAPALSPYETVAAAPGRLEPRPS